MCTETKTKTIEENEDKKPEDDDVYDQIPRDVLISMDTIIDLYYKEAKKEYGDLKDIWSETGSDTHKQQITDHIFPHLERVRRLLRNLDVDDMGLGLLPHGCRETMDNGGEAGSSLKS